MEKNGIDFAFARMNISLITDNNLTTDTSLLAIVLASYV